MKPLDMHGFPIFRLCQYEYAQAISFPNQYFCAKYYIDTQIKCLYYIFLRQEGGLILRKLQGKGKQNPVECISFLRSSVFLTFNQSFVCLAFISITAVNLDAVEKREPGGVLRSDRCPKPGRFGLCAELCGVGGGCSEGKICCSNGCGHQCMSPGKY